MAWNNVHISHVNVAASRTLTAYKGWLVCRVDSSLEALSLVVPDAATVGELWIVKATSDTNVITVTPFVVGQTFNGESSISISELGDCLRLHSDGSNFFHRNPSKQVP